MSRLTKGDIAEVKAYANPPRNVIMAMGAVAVMLNKPDDWASIKKELTDPAFMKRLINFDKDNISDAVIKKLERYVNNPEFLPQIAMQSSLVAGALTAYVRSVYEYHQTLQQVR